MRRRRLLWALTVSGCALALAACGASAVEIPTALSGEITLLPGTAESNQAQPATGDFSVPEGGPPPKDEQVRRVSQRWVGLKVGSVGDLDGVLTNGVGLTLYRFDRDSADPPTSNCTGDCAQTWPKVLVGEDSRLFINDGIDRSAIGSIPSGDGTFQVTVGGWPIYRFSGDTRSGQANGQGSGGTWFAVGPDGRKAGGGRAGDDNRDDENRGDENRGDENRGDDNRGDDRDDNDGGNNGGGNNGGDDNRGSGGNGRNTAESITLFDEPGRSGSGAAQGVSNSRGGADGCVDIPRAGRASSVSASGSYTLYTGPDCAGRSVRLNGDVDDLRDQGFDDAAASVRLAPRG